MDAPSLDSLRQEIDAIDGELHGLIRRRAALVDRIGASKPPGGLALRPGREAKVMRQRLETHQGPFPAAAVYRMWREMMCAFTLMQTPDIKVAICRPHDQPGYWDLARDHFGCQITFVANDSPAQVLAAVRANPSTLGVVPGPIEGARGIRACVLARREPEESGDDRALISLESVGGLSRNRISGALAKAGLPAFTSVLDQLGGGVHHHLRGPPGGV